MTKRLRIFAGPNGSGKTTITNIVKEYVNLGVYVNADDIKSQLSTKRKLDFKDYGLPLNKQLFIDTLKHSSFVPRLADVDLVLSHLDFANTVLTIKEDTAVDDYFVSFIADYLRTELLETSSKFTIETVMSHPSKLEFIKSAKDKGFKVYLYFVSLVDPQLNIRRVQTRVAQGGHSVDEQKILSRYLRTMNYLLPALKLVDNAYIFDNSTGEPKMFATKEKGEIQIQGEYIPTWFEKYVYRNR